MGVYGETFHLFNKNIAENLFALGHKTISSTICRLPLNCFHLGLMTFTLLETSDQDILCLLCSIIVL